MRAADDFQRIRPGLFFWQAYDPAVKVDLSSCAVETEAGLVFIDPIPLENDALERMIDGARSGAIILTNANHARAAADFREQFEIPIHAHTEARGLSEIEADSWVEEGEILCGSLRVVSLPGGAKGEMALHHPEGVLSVGDAIINLEESGFGLLPAKYCENAKRLRRSVEKLLQFSFETLTFAHGLPVASQAKQRLEALILSL